MRFCRICGCMCVTFKIKLTLPLSRKPRCIFHNLLLRRNEIVPIHVVAQKNVFGSIYAHATRTTFTADINHFLSELPAVRNNNSDRRRAVFNK